MKKIIFLFLICINAFVNAQELKSHSYLNNKMEVLSETKETKISITESEIILKNYNDNSTKDLIRKIEKTETKPYNGINCTWYYCISTEKDVFRNDYRKSIFIYDKQSQSLLFADFVSEVDVFWKKFFL
ncbi:hypothetical protein [Flavobacterium sp. 1355]|uniref:hypothetical protein n=1 Tax=Flavobacterium sp. 1355 TaxID=2806571 RepID=UPI001AE440F0|nr:hypothetical protein [Flavobacterium sp. 1355]MBP1222055.1 hypothetical protein [Flavobacterium sp. 1355]